MKYCLVDFTYEKLKLFNLSDSINLVTRNLNQNFLRPFMKIIELKQIKPFQKSELQKKNVLDIIYIYLATGQNRQLNQCCRVETKKNKVSFYTGILKIPNKC